MLSRQVSLQQQYGGAVSVTHKDPERMTDRSDQPYFNNSTIKSTPQHVTSSSFFIILCNLKLCFLLI